MEAGGNTRLRVDHRRRCRVKVIPRGRTQPQKLATRGRAGCGLSRTGRAEALRSLYWNVTGSASAVGCMPLLGAALAPATSLRCMSYTGGAHPLPHGNNRWCLRARLTRQTGHPTVEADAGWPRRDDIHRGPERPDGGCRSGSALERGVRPHLARRNPSLKPEVPLVCGIYSRCKPNTEPWSLAKRGT